jgi:hypothetical protein
MGPHEDFDVDYIIDFGVEALTGSLSATTEF